MPTAEPPLERRLSALRFCRRKFLRLGVLTASAFLLPRTGHPSPALPVKPERRLAFFNTHTGESVDVFYLKAGCYDHAALGAINHVLRDHRTGETKPIETSLLDLLHALCTRLHICRPLHVISGYRSPETNAVLHAKSRGVASRSLHLCGKAIDIRVPGIRTGELRDHAVALSAGGVGYYPRSDFVHIDVGRVRSW